MSEKHHKEKPESGFPEDSYTEEFIKSQENQYNFDYKSGYDFESHARKPLILYTFNFLFCFAGVLCLIWLLYKGIPSLWAEKNIMGIVATSVMGGGGGILMLMITIKYLRKIIKRIK